MSFSEFGFGEGDENIGSKTKRFKAKEGEKYRVSFIWWPGIETGKPNMDAATPKFIGCKRLFLQGVGYFIDKGPDFVKIAGTPSKMQVATLICKWPTDEKGAVDKGRFQNGEYSVMPWIISIDKYRNIEQNHREFPLGQHDLSLACTDTQYQKITISPCRENLFRKLYEKDPAGVAAKIITEAQEAIKEIGNELAQDLTIDQIRERLGRQGGGSGPSGGGIASSDTKQFDSMLDDILG